MTQALPRYAMHINGAEAESTSGEWFESFNPFTGRPWALVARGDATDVDRAVQAAHTALKCEWGAITPSQRGALLRRLGDLIARDAERLTEIEVRDNGKLDTRNNRL